MLKRSLRQLKARFPIFATCALGLIATSALSLAAQAECKFSSTAYPAYDALTLDPAGLALNGGAFIHHGNVMAAGRIDNLIFFHVGSEIIPSITNVVSATLSLEKMLATYTFIDHSLIRVSLKGVTTVPHSQQSVPAIYTNANGLNQRFFLLCY